MNKKGTLRCVYVKEKNPFKEILDYLKDIKKAHNIELVEYDSEQSVDKNFMKNSIKNFVENYGIKAIITGTRSTDPYSRNLNPIHLMESHKGWPKGQRVMPIY